MKKKHKKPDQLLVATNVDELAEMIGLDNPADILIMQYKAKLSSIAAKAIKESGLKVNDIVKRSGVARSKVSAIKNGALGGISCDLFLRVISVTGTKLTFKVAS